MLEDLIWMFAKCHGTNHLLLLISDAHTALERIVHAELVPAGRSLPLHTIESTYVLLKCAVLVVKGTLLTFKVGQLVWIRTGPDWWRHINAGILIGCKHLEYTLGTFLMELVPLRFLWFGWIENPVRIWWRFVNLFSFLNFECGVKFHRIKKRLGFPTPWPWNPQISLEETLILIASLELPKSSISCNPLGCSVLLFHSVRSRIHFQNTSFSFSFLTLSRASFSCLLVVVMVL